MKRFTKFVRASVLTVGLALGAASAASALGLGMDGNGSPRVIAVSTSLNALYCGILIDPNGRCGRIE